MENSDEISDSEVINRIENLERIVNKFRITSAGDGTVFGGFGKLPKNQPELPIEQRFANVQQARTGFDINGLNVAVSGTFKDGFKFT